MAFQDSRSSSSGSGDALISARASMFCKFSQFPAWMRCCSIAAFIHSNEAMVAPSALGLPCFGAASWSSMKYLSSSAAKPVSS